MSGSINLGDGMTLGRKGNGWDFKNKRAGIRYDAKSDRFVYDDGSLTASYGGKDDWQVGRKGQTSWQVGPKMVSIGRDGRTVGYSPENGVSYDDGRWQGRYKSGGNWQLGYRGPVSVTAGPGSIEVKKDKVRVGYSRKKGPYISVDNLF